MYDKEVQLLLRDMPAKVKVLRCIQAAEAILLLHALVITYARYNIPKAAQEDEILVEAEIGLSMNVQKYLDWLESELSQSRTKLCGDHVTAADTMIQFSIDFTLTTRLGAQRRT